MQQDPWLQLRAAARSMMFNAIQSGGSVGSNVESMHREVVRAAAIEDKSSGWQA
jgi:hypothetical protein